jgi:hypothetical protein
MTNEKKQSSILGAAPMDNGAVKFIHFCVRSNKRWQFHPAWDEGSAAREKKTRRTKERKKERKKGEEEELVKDEAFGCCDFR